MIDEKEKKEYSLKYIKDNGYYIDIYIATYNRLEYLKKTVWSIIASGMKSILKPRLTVFDDKSTDETPC